MRSKYGCAALAKAMASGVGSPCKREGFPWNPGYGKKISFAEPAPASNAVSAPRAPPLRKMPPTLANPCAMRVIKFNTWAGVSRPPTPA